MKIQKRHDEAGVWQPLEVEPCVDPQYHNGFLRWFKSGPRAGEYIYFSDRYWEPVHEKTWHPANVKRNDNTLSIEGPRDVNGIYGQIIVLKEGLRVTVTGPGRVFFEELR
jgi:hypothetical protein